jgi:hypothetical protein
MYRGSQDGNRLLSGRKSLTSKTKPIVLQRDGVMELSCQGKSVVVKWEGAVVLECELPAANDHTGFWVGGGWDSGTVITRLLVSGRLDPAWLASALEAVPDPE